MSDIVDRLRGGWEWPPSDTMTEAADIITALREEVERLRVETNINYADGFHDGDENGAKIKKEFIDKMEAELARLRAALGDIIQDSFSLYAIDVARAALTPPPAEKK